MVELLCPSCSSLHWGMDCDYRGAELIGQKELSYRERTYFCPHCQSSRKGYVVLQKSPPEFFLQPHELYPMNRVYFSYWVKMLRRNFPDDPMLAELGKTWYPSGGRGWFRGHARHLFSVILRQARVAVRPPST